MNEPGGGERDGISLQGRKKLGMKTNEIEASGEAHPNNKIQRYMAGVCASNDPPGIRFACQSANNSDKTGIAVRLRTGSRVWGHSLRRPCDSTGGGPRRAGPGTGKGRRTPPTGGTASGGATAWGSAAWGREEARGGEGSNPISRGEKGAAHRRTDRNPFARRETEDAKSKEEGGGNKTAETFNTTLRHSKKNWFQLMTEKKSRIYGRVHSQVLGERIWRKT